MTDNHTQDNEQFRATVREFLASALVPEIKAATNRGTAVFHDPAISLAWQSKLAERGWAAYMWPVEYGGTGWSKAQRYIFEYECAVAGAPILASMGLFMVAFVIMKFGTLEQKSFYLPRIVSGEDYWCQGYSEPQAGSDLASLRCRAEDKGDHYLVNGQKIWTTHAHFANRIFCLVRTRTDDKPQKGISFLLIDMKQPGVTVRPIISISGDHDVNEVFLENVRVPKSDLVGVENEGWTCAKYLLEYERGGSVTGQRLKLSLARLKHIARQEDAGDGRALADLDWVRRRIAEIELNVRAHEFTERRHQATLENGRSPGPQSSLMKIEFSEIDQAISELALQLVGPYGVLNDARRPLPPHSSEDIGRDYNSEVGPRYFNKRASSIYGGSNEIQRTIIARNILGL